MKHAEVFKQEINTKIEQLTEYLFEQIREMDNRSMEKNQRISLLSGALTQTRNELATLQADYQTKLAEIAQLQADLAKSRLLQQGDPELIIIYQVEDVFNYPRDVIRWYFNELDLTRLSFPELFISLQGLIKLADCEMTDELIYHICDSCLNYMTREQMSELLTLLHSYLEVQFREQHFSTAGIYYFIATIYTMRWTALLKDFLPQTRGFVEDLLFKIDEPSFTLREPLILLKVYFELQMHNEAGKWLEQILLTMVPNQDLEIKDKAEFLYLAFLYHQDDKVLGFLPDLRPQIQNSHLPELQAFKSFAAGITQKQTAAEAIKRILELKKESAIINSQLKVKVLDQMCQRLSAVVDDEKTKAAEKAKAAATARATTEAPTVQNSPKAQAASRTESNGQAEPSMKQFHSVIRIQNGAVSCPYDFTSLKSIKAMLAKFTDAQKTKVSGYVPVKLLYCPTCNRTYINYTMESDLSRLVRLKYIDIIQYVPEISKAKTLPVDKTAFVPLAKPQSQPQPVTSNELPNIHNDSYGERWSEESPLRKLGYTTNLSTQARWDILINKAVPKLGYRRVCEYLMWFITDKSKIKQKDFSRAIAIWEQDLKRLEQHMWAQNVKRKLT